jgi:hypothetical protein
MQVTAVSLIIIIISYHCRGTEGVTVMPVYMSSKERSNIGVMVTRVILRTCFANYEDVGMPLCIIVPSQYSKENIIWL